MALAVISARLVPGMIMPSYVACGLAGLPFRRFFVLCLAYAAELKELPPSHPRRRARGGERRRAGHSDKPRRGPLDVPTVPDGRASIAEHCDSSDDSLKLCVIMFEPAALAGFFNELPQIALAQPHHHTIAKFMVQYIVAEEPAH